MAGTKRRRSRGRRRVFLRAWKNILREKVDADEIDRTGEIPQNNIDDLFAMGAFGVKIPKQYRRARLVPGQLRTGGHACLGAGMKI